MLMDRGQWATLERWLRQLPDDVLASHPGLIYCQADIAAAKYVSRPLPLRSVLTQPPPQVYYQV